MISENHSSYPTGYSENNNLQPAYIFPNAIIRDNVIGYYNGGTDTGNLSVAVSVVRGDSVLVDGNVINLISKFPYVPPNIDGKDYRLQEVAARDVDFRLNTTASGEVIPALNTNGAFVNPAPPVTPIPDPYEDILSDSAILAFL